MEPELCQEAKPEDRVLGRVGAPRENEAEMESSLPRPSPALLHKCDSGQHSAPGGLGMEVEGVSSQNFISDAGWSSHGLGLSQCLTHDNHSETT